MDCDICYLLIKIGPNSIPTVASTKYLENYLNLRVSPMPRVNSVLANIINGLKSLWPTLKPNFSIRPDVKLYCYKQLIPPLMLFGFVAWCELTAHQMGSLRAHQRKFLRISLGVSHPPYNQAVYTEVSTIRSDAFLLSQSLTHDNSLVREATLAHPA